jgi:hypothetical protein
VVTKLGTARATEPIDLIEYPFGWIEICGLPAVHKSPTWGRLGTKVELGERIWPTLSDGFSLQLGTARSHRGFAYRAL